MSAHKSLLDAMLLHGPQWHRTPDTFVRISVHNVQLIGEVEGASIKPNVTVGT